MVETGDERATETRGFSRHKELVNRVVVGILGAGVVLGSLLVDWLAISLFAFLTLWALWELMRMFGLRRRDMILPTVIHLGFFTFMGPALLIGQAPIMQTDYVVGMLIISLLTLWTGGLFWCAFVREGSCGVPVFLVWTLGFLWITIPMAMWIVGGLVIPISPTRWWLWWLLIVWATDIFSFFVGRWLGSHHLPVHISPRKTWEGVLGGIVAGTLIGFLLAENMVDFRGGRIEALFWAFMGASAGVLGDLFESSIKRFAGVTTSGRLLGAHGGILDRIDSWLWIFCIQWMVLAFRWPWA